jgi:hypothetical protein
LVAVVPVPSSLVALASTVLTACFLRSLLLVVVVVEILLLQGVLEVLVVAVVDAIPQGLASVGLA